jgi:hypothetical protein
MFPALLLVVQKYKNYGTRSWNLSWCGCRPCGAGCIHAAQNRTLLGAALSVIIAICFCVGFCLMA